MAIDSSTSPCGIRFAPVISWYDPVATRIFQFGEGSSRLAAPHPTAAVGRVALHDLVAIASGPAIVTSSSPELTTVTRLNGVSQSQLLRRAAPVSQRNSV